MENAYAVLIAIAIDLLVGDPPNVPHPIRYIGGLISFLEKHIRMRFRNLKLGGFVLLLSTLIAVTGPIHAVLYFADKISPALSFLLKTYIVFSGIASKCLAEEAKKIYAVLKEGTLEEARVKISYLVGRDTSQLDREEITRATVETVAENTVDGVLAPLFFAFAGCLAGIPAELVYFYKATNTLDSMVGYKNEKYKDIGFFSAKFDDLLNYIPARTGAVFMCLSGIFLKLDVKNAFKVMIRDRKNHKSPNCAYPEGAVAGLLNVQLGGTNVYFGEKVYKPTIGDKNRLLEKEDIIKTIKVMYVSEFIFTGFLLVTTALLVWI